MPRTSTNARLCVALLLGLLGQLSVAIKVSAQGLPPPYRVPPSYDGVRTSTRYIRSSDGTRLAVAVVRPTRQGVVATERLPVIVQQTIGELSPNGLTAARYFTDRGYVWVAQSRRGTGASFGSSTGFLTEFDTRDAKATIEWAGTQPFSSGKVVTYGCSNEGLWQYNILPNAPLPLVAVAPLCASAAFYDHGVAYNGIHFLPMGDKPYTGECNSTAGVGRADAPGTPKPVDEDGDGAMLRAAAIGQKCNAPFVAQYWLNMPRDGHNSFAGNRPALDDSVMMNWAAVKRSNIPILQIGGWFDTGIAGQFEAQRLWRGRTVMLPRVHGNPILGGGYPNDAFDVKSELLRWYDHYAKGTTNGAGKPGVLYYTINAPSGREWRTAPNWPSAVGAPRPYYLTESGLSAAPPAATGGAAIYPQQEVKWFDGKYQVLGRVWAGDMSGADAKSLVHTLPPLTADTEVTGTPVAKLWISADQSDVNVFAVLEDVSPDGRSTYVSDGRLRASWRKRSNAPFPGNTWNWHRGYAQDLTPLQSGEPVELVFDFYPVSYVFRQGHRIRVAIVTSTGDKHMEPPLARGAAPTLTLYRNRAHPSRIELPTKAGTR